MQTLERGLTLSEQALVPEVIEYLTTIATEIGASDIYEAWLRVGFWGFSISAGMNYEEAVSFQTDLLSSFGSVPNFDETDQKLFEASGVLRQKVESLVEARIEQHIPASHFSDWLINNMLVYHSQLVA